MIGGAVRCRGRAGIKTLPQGSMAIASGAPSAPASWPRGPLCIEPDRSYEEPLAPAVLATANCGIAIKKRQQGWRFFMR
jgi:hypothetical protein